MDTNPSPVSSTTTITDIRIPFWRLILFFVKASIAAIPAAIILGIIYLIVAAAIFALIGDRL